MGTENEAHLGQLRAQPPKENFLSRIMGGKRSRGPVNPPADMREDLITGNPDVGELLPKREEKEFTVDHIRKVERTDMKHILEWLSDPETRTHLSPLDEVKKVPTNESEKLDAIAHLSDYYFVNKGKPNKITPLVAADKMDKPLGVVTMRWSEDLYIGGIPRMAGLERLVVDPEARGEGVGTKLAGEALNLAFSEGEGAPYRGKGANEVRLWVMTRMAGGASVPNWNKNIQFFEQFGFGLVPGNPEWEGYAQKKGLEYIPGEQAYWMSLPREKYKPLEKPQK